MDERSVVSARSATIDERRWGSWLFTDRHTLKLSCPANITQSCAQSLYKTAFNDRIGYLIQIKRRNSKQIEQK